MHERQKIRESIKKLEVELTVYEAKGNKRAANCTRKIIECLKKKEAGAFDKFKTKKLVTDECIYDDDDTI